MRAKKSNPKLVLFIIFLAFLSISLALMQFASDMDEIGKTNWLYAVGTLFWTGLAGTILLAILLIVRAAKYRKTNKIKAPPGIFCFMRNSAAAVFDPLMILCFLALIIFLVLSLDNHLIFAAIGGSTFCFGMHCALNDESNFPKIRRQRGQENERNEEE